MHKEFGEGRLCDGYSEDAEATCAQLASRLQLDREQQQHGEIVAIAPNHGAVPLSNYCDMCPVRSLCLGTVAINK